MALSIFDIVNHIYSKAPLEFSTSDYKPWMINKALSNNTDTLFFANEMNMYYNLDADMQYAFMLNGISKGKRYGKWHKKEDDVDVDLVSEFFSINKRQAVQYLKLMSDEQLITIKEKMMKGGRNGRNEPRSGGRLKGP